MGQRASISYPFKFASATAISALGLFGLEIPCGILLLVMSQWGHVCGEQSGEWRGMVE
jgi:hypothetical protein